MAFAPELSAADARKRLHTVTQGTMTYVYVLGKVIGTAARVRNHPGCQPREVYEANSGERGVRGECRDTLNEAVSAVLGR